MPNQGENKKRFAELIDVLQLEEALERFPRHVSQGQRQRAALARALVLLPRLLLIDEGTSALDEALAKKVWSYLRELAGRGTTILASTHDTRLADSCDAHYTIRSKTLTLVPVR